MWKIGNVEIKNRIVFAPMAGISNISFRTIIKEMGAGLIYSEMISDKAICFKNKKTLKMCIVNQEERPIVLQLFGHDIDTMVPPETGRCRGRDRYTALPLLLHPVHRRSAIINFAYPVVGASIEEDPFRCSRLPCIDVRHDPHISYSIVHCKPVTTCSGRTLCWPRPSYAYLLSS